MGEGNKLTLPNIRSPKAHGTLNKKIADGSGTKTKDVPNESVDQNVQKGEKKEEEKYEADFEQ